MPSLASAARNAFEGGRTTTGVLAHTDLLPFSSIVKHHARVSITGGRNIRLKIQPTGFPETFIKTSGSADGKSLVHEMAVYDSLLELSQVGSPATLPVLRRVLSPSSPHRLVLDLVPENSSLRDRIRVSRELDPNLFTLLGGALGQLHNSSASLDSVADLPPFKPWVLSIQCPPTEIYQDKSSAAQQLLIKRLQNVPVFADLIEQARELTNDNTASALVHGDLKWDNVLTPLPTDPNNSPPVIFVDWEHAGLGNPLWDVGTIFSEFLTLWALSIPIVGGSSSDTYVHLAAYSLEELQLSIAAFWRGYARTREFVTSRISHHLSSSVRLAGAQLIQMVFARAQSVMHITPHLDLLLQLSLNIMERPDEAATDLLGLGSALESRNA